MRDYRQVGSSLCVSQERRRRRGNNDGMADEGKLPASCAWMNDELIENTISVWSEYLGRPVERDEAIEMLQNVKRLGEVLLEIHEEADTDARSSCASTGLLPP
ncbi:hypothetical protein FBQ96_03785 [Nitrospirales bacterium NOB]|nr:hypothetical protein [Nitrospirales bacterium NOB]